MIVIVMEGSECNKAGLVLIRGFHVRGPKRGENTRDTDVELN